MIGISALFGCVIGIVIGWVFAVFRYENGFRSLERWSDFLLDGWRDAVRLATDLNKYTDRMESKIPDRGPDGRYRRRESDDR